MAVNPSWWQLTILEMACIATMVASVLMIAGVAYSLGSDAVCSH